MQIIVVEYGGTEHHIECESFEFRTNNVTNWIRIKHSDGSKEMIYEIATIKAENKGYEEVLKNEEIYCDRNLCFNYECSACPANNSQISY